MRLLIEHLPPTPSSAYFRARHPKSWWWTPELDFLSSILYTVQGANWQRSGGKGTQPERITRPDDAVGKPLNITAQELAERKRALRRRQKGR